MKTRRNFLLCALFLITSTAGCAPIGTAQQPGPVAQVTERVGNSMFPGAGTVAKWILITFFGGNAVAGVAAATKEKEGV